MGNTKRTGSDAAGKDSSKDSKKPKTSGVKVETLPGATAASGRVIEIPNADKIGEDFDVWALP